MHGRNRARQQHEGHRRRRLYLLHHEGWAEVAMSTATHEIELLAHYLRNAMETSRSDLVFPAPDGNMHAKKTQLELLLRRPRRRSSALQPRCSARLARCHPPDHSVAAPIT